MKSKSAIIQIKATEQYFLVVLTLHKVVLIVSVTIQMNVILLSRYTLLLWYVYVQLRWFY